ncbi:LysR family transcriptional regulator [Burkholderia ambifaria]|jgi:DNA-binding transcriptional LysR family regulator|uniref:Transcriptional regulator, LysR family n=1 Tax=Burkholderia ambifaria (strain ATCC BAA-244 / DSM 16087 / CCUG 44356 / LMG 19182 / AMMD) TaxID=339670 RepID=Q0B3U9_BURCM|nr:LysR substrate-binding domain-containing protein [Burkholderia ambifaria]ABI91174.1 transcriptional regulator, LysR family [Burkholderia ambifaria AMMD]AJY26894.1 bacterial regulatory helix-turn-helix, lysR family protein [Burkholderia ambifaria AMMD]ELK6210175.1 LysR family transcriptional regulator [Burkholderia ambifaria]MBR7933779.1 LysR family transcriptional regulator [Burkholderia ambifaria]MBR8226535.1 LysR family transcriptional regulator [Burkholderia ambifaria]
MPRENLNDLLVFLAVARDRSFTRAAARLGVSQSALSQTVRDLETRLGVRLLTRTTRSVSTTEAGEELFQAVAPRIDEIEMKLAAVADFRDKPAGVVRITATEHPIDTIIWPKLRRVLPDYPDIRVELSVDYGLANIVEERYDIGVRYGDQVAKDMIAVRISPDIRMTMVASPAYLDGRKPPKTPQDLLDHDCVTLRLATAKGIYAWELKKGRNEIQARVSGRITCNTQPHMVQAALDGFGIAFVTEDIVLDHVRSGQLRIVMPDWCPVFPGYHAYYPSRRQASRAFSIVIDALRHRA